MCDVSHSPPATLIKEFYSNLFVHFEDTSGNYLTNWIRGKNFKITKHIIYEALGVPLVRRPTFLYIEPRPIHDVMSLLCGRSVTWGLEPRINSSELTEVNYLFFKIVCRNIFPISHIHTIPLDKCAFL